MIGRVLACAIRDAKSPVPAVGCRALAARSGLIWIGREIEAQPAAAGRDKGPAIVEAVADPSYATVVGLAVYGASRLAGAGMLSRRASNSGGVDKLTSRVKTWLQEFF